MPSPEKSTATLLGVLRLYRELLGRKLYVLIFLMPLATLSDSLGIALLLPLLAALDGGSNFSGQSGGFVGRLLASLPLPDAPLALLALVALAFLLKAGLRFVTEAVYRSMPKTITSAILADPQKRVKPTIFNAGRLRREYRNSNVETANVEIRMSKSENESKERKATGV